jgi:hypothetical protein
LPLQTPQVGVDFCKTRQQRFSGVIELQNPFTAENTFMQSWQNAGAVYMTGGELRDTTSYTAFTLTCTAGTITGGFISVYGYTK